MAAPLIYDSPTVTVVTPTLNAARFFPDCLRSLQSQQAVNVQHIVVDDGSTDGTVELAKSAGAHVIDGERRGLYAAMNLGLSRATGDYVGVLNADDYLFEGALARLVSAMRKRARPWSVGRLVWVDGQARSLGTIAPPPPWFPPSLLACLGWNWMHHQTTYMTREFWDRLGGFDVSFRSAADYDLLIRARKAAAFAAVTNATGAFRRHGTNISMTVGVAVNEELRIRECYGPHFRGAAFAAAIGARAYVNARNPRWSIAKLSTARRT